jgi:hypothetical protein
MSSLRRRITTALALVGALALAATLGLAAAGPASAQSRSPEAAAARALVQAQLDAFANDNAELAFSYASPGIQAQFGSADTFVRMVREHYPVVYRPASVSFDALEGQGDQRIQPVRMADDDGGLWVAYYLMVRQDGAWRIGGCQLRHDARARSI